MSSEESAGQPSDVFTLEAGLIVPAAVCEMLAHRAGDTLWLLPALPRDWKEGHVRGITVEGGHRIDLVFSDYTLEKAVIHPGSDETLHVVIGAAAERYEALHARRDSVVSGDTRLEVQLRTGAEAVELVRFGVH
jgi:hypothetical protein